MALQDKDALQRLSRRLDEREAELRLQVGELLEEEAQAQDQSAGREVDDLEEIGEHRTRQAVRQVERERDQQELREIEAARQRMHEGVYGQCVDCGADIAVPRLMVRPAAARCVDCQAIVERSVPAVPAVELPGSLADPNRRG
jgi:DnaK suppressor protein